MFGRFKSLTLGKKIAVVAVPFFGFTAVVGAIAGPPPESETEQNQQQEEQAAEPVVETKTEIATVKLPYDKVTEEDPTFDEGTVLSATAGVEGEKEIIYEITYSGGIEINRKVISEKVVKDPVNEVIKKGSRTVHAPTPSSSNCDPNYLGGCVPNVSYDLDCADIGFEVTVVDSDPHRFDGDHDGYGCEAY